MVQNVDASVHTPSEAGSLRASGRSWSRLCASVHTPSEAGSLRASGRLSAGTGMGTQTEKARGKQRVTGMGTQTEKARGKQRVTAVSAVAGPSGGEVCELSCSRAVHCLTRGVLVLQVQHNPAPAVLLSEHTAAPLEDCEGHLRMRSRPSHCP